MNLPEGRTGVRNTRAINKTGRVMRMHGITALRATRPLMPVLQNTSWQLWMLLSGSGDLRGYRMEYSPGHESGFPVRVQGRNRLQQMTLRREMRGHL